MEKWSLVLELYNMRCFAPWNGLELVSSLDTRVKIDLEMFDISCNNIWPNFILIFSSIFHTNLSTLHWELYYGKKYSFPAKFANKYYYKG